MRGLAVLVKVEREQDLKLNEASKAGGICDQVVNGTEAGDQR